MSRLWALVGLAYSLAGVAAAVTGHTTDAAIWLGDGILAFILVELQVRHE